MAKASDNAYPSVLVVPGAAPASPAAGQQRLYLDSGDGNKLKRKDSGGVVVVVEGGAAGTSVLLAVKQSLPAADAAVTSTSLTLVDVHATDGAFTFVAPSSGKVLLKGSISVRNLTAGAPVNMGFRDAAAIIAGSPQRVLVGGDLERVEATFLEVGLTAGTTYERRLAFSVGAAGSGTAEVRYGSTNERGPLILEAWSA